VYGTEVREVNQKKETTYEAELKVESCFVKGKREQICGNEVAKYEDDVEGCGVLWGGDLNRQ